nr:ATP-binding protein [Planctomycetota bacterium]
RDQDALRIEVEDNGPGIPGHLRRRIFRPFVTGDAKDGGRGVGLFIVRQAVRRLGGSIRVESGPKGTRFGIDLPALA